MPSDCTNQLIQHIQAAPADQAQNLLTLFDALEEAVQNSTIGLDPTSIFSDTFTAFYLKQAQLTTAENPDSLAAHLLLIAQKALLDQVSGRETQSLHHAKTVAEALVQSHCKPVPHKPVRMVKHHWFAMAASALLLSTLGWYGWTYQQVHNQPTLAANITDINNSQRDTNTAGITASQASETYKTIEITRTRNCRYLHAHQKPEEKKEV